MGHAAGVRRGVASIYHMSFDLISVLGKVDLWSSSYIGMKNIFLENRILKIDSSQTAPPKMTAMTIGWYQIFCEHIDFTMFLARFCLRWPPSGSFWRSRWLPFGSLFTTLSSLLHPLGSLLLTFSMFSNHLEPTCSQDPSQIAPGYHFGWFWGGPGTKVMDFRTNFLDVLMRFLR